MDRQSKTIHTAPLVDWLARHAKPDRGTAISQAAGIVGIILYSFVSCVVLGVLPWGADSLPYDKDLTSVLFPTTAALVGVWCYVSTLLTLHTIASCLLPLTCRLTLIFVVIYVSLRLCTVIRGDQIEAIHVVMLIPFSLGGLAMRRFRGWRSLAWGQAPQSMPLTILGLLDVTTAAALTLMVLTSAIRWAEIEPESLLSFAPASLFMAFFGLHCWLRLCEKCHE